MANCPAARPQRREKSVFAQATTTARVTSARTMPKTSSNRIPVFPRSGETTQIARFRRAVAHQTMTGPQNVSKKNRRMALRFGSMWFSLPISARFGRVVSMCLSAGRRTAIGRQTSFSMGTPAKWVSREKSVAACSRAKAAIQMSFCGIGVPFALSVR